MRIRGYHRYIINKERLLKVIDTYIERMVKDSLRYMNWAIKRFYKKLDNREGL
ncbi:hypothetical protein LCGC14_2063230 [marine sediment metagenome]|uniref:Uncharacterized protein n=2 Tax=marine sediment metagenome TaxID=412755 RepID=A0A0F9F7X1_9ZZZZ